MLFINKERLNWFLLVKILIHILIRLFILMEFLKRAFLVVSVEIFNQVNIINNINCVSAFL